MEFQKVIKKLKDMLGSAEGRDPLKISDSHLAQALGMTNVALSYAKKKNRVPIDKVARLCAKHRVSINWVLFDQVPHSLDENTSELMRIRYFKDINASAGGGTLNYTEEGGHLYLDREMVELLGGTLGLKNIEAIKVYGDSMEPLLKDGSILLLDRSKQDIRYGGVFVLNICGNLFVKRVSRNARGEIDLISENALYPIERIVPEELEVIGRAIGSFQGV